MKIFKFFAVAAAALLLALPCKAAINLENGIKAGKTLLALYTQYKTDGKLDFSNATTISNVLTLASEIKGLKDTNTSAQTNSFLSGLISGSNNLVNTSNSATALSSLTSLANMDLSSLTGSAATSAASSLLSKIGGSKSQSTSSNTTATAASSLLTNLFGSLAK